MTNEQTHIKHPYHQVLQWVAEGKEIECRPALTVEWRSTDYDTVLICSIHGVKSVSYLQPQDFRIKPEPKPDVTEILSNTMRQGWVKVPTPVCFNENIKVTRCGETHKIKSVEII